MRKKFLSAFMLGALTLAATSTFVSCKDYDGDISALKSDVNSLNTALEALKNQHAQDVASLQAAIDKAKADLQAAIDKKEDKTVVAAIAERVTGLENRMAAAESRLDAVESAIKTLEENKADKTELARVEGLVVALTGRVQTNEGAIVKLNGDVEKLANDLGELGIKVSDLKTYCEQNFDLQGKAIDKAVERIQSLEDMLSDYPEVKAQVATNKQDIADLKGRVQKAEDDIVDLAARMGQAELDIKANASAISELTGVVNGLRDRIVKVEGRLDVLEVLVNKRLTSIYFSPTTYVNGVEAINFAALQYIDWNNGLGEDAPNLWLNNIAQSNTINRIDDGTTTAIYYLNPSSVDESSINGGIAGLSFIAHNAENILLNATGVYEKEQKDVESPIKVVADKSTLKDGKLTLKLKKNTTKSFVYDPTVEHVNIADNFTVVALKAPLSSKAKTAAEGDQEINVYSDWARLTETVTTPYIHNNIAEWGYVDGDQAFEGEYSHFYNFKEIYNMWGEPKPTGGYYSNIEALHYNAYDRADAQTLISEKVAYNGTLDLKPMVTVCDTKGNIIDWKAYGLEFEFNKLDTYMVYDEGTTKHSINQQQFYTIADGVVTPNDIKGNKGEAARDAIGKTPIVQIVLRDRANNAVVDVRYMVLTIVDKIIEPKELGVVDGVDKFDCGNNYVVEVTSTDMNKFAASLNLTSGVEFTKLYRFALPEEGDMTKLWSTDLSAVIGTVQIRHHGGDVSQADELVVTFDAEKFPLDYELYHRGTKTVTGLIKVWDVYFRYAYYVTVNMTVKFDKSRQMDYADGYGKIANYWKNSKNTETWSKGDGLCPSIDGKHPEVFMWNYVVANPTLGTNKDNTDTEYHEGDELDTQLLYNLLNAYAKGTASPGSATQLVKNLNTAEGDDAWFEFDQAQLPKVLNNTYHVKDLSDEIQVLYVNDYKVPNFVAYIKKHTGKIQLFECNDVCAYDSKNHHKVATQSSYDIDKMGIHGYPTKPAQAIVGYDGVADEPATKNGIPVILKSKQCEYTDTIDRFVVRFEKPLEYTWTAQPVELDDQYDYGSCSKQNWSDWFTLKEAFGRERVLVGKTPASDAAYLRKWYGIRCLAENPADCRVAAHKHKDNWIMPFIKVEKKQNIDNVCVDATYKGKKLSEYLDQKGGVKYVLVYNAKNVNDKDYGKDSEFIFYNNSGNAITEDMEILVPVTVETKWRVWENQIIKITVKQKTTTSK